MSIEHEADCRSITKPGRVCNCDAAKNRAYRDALVDIADIAWDYDGMDGSVEAMKKLVDELRAIAVGALNELRN